MSKMLQLIKSKIKFVNKKLLIMKKSHKNKLKKYKHQKL